MIDKLIAQGWRAVELGVLAVAVSLLLHVLLGPGAGSVVEGVADNTVRLLQQFPPGVVLGLAALLVIAHFVRNRRA